MATAADLSVTHLIDDPVTVIQPFSSSYCDALEHVAHNS
jgi:hypothetical protein